jgi:GDP-L-fucose synthase
MTSKELDLREQKAVEDFIKKEKPLVIIDAAAKVGGILANDTYPFEFLMDNMLIQNNLIRSAHENDVPKFIFLGSSCIYPKFAPQPLKEEYLLTDSLEPTNEWYAIAKISGVKLIEALRKEYARDYVSLMPTNLYGPNDNFDLNSSHVLPAMIRKFHDAKLNGNLPLELWGTGSPMREFLHVDDLGQAVLFALENTLNDYLYNVGSGKELRIKELAKQIQSIVGHNGEIKWDSSKPDGTPRKLLCSKKINRLGWKPRISLTNGISRVYKTYKEQLTK